MGSVSKASSAVGKVSSAISGQKQTLKQVMQDGGWKVIHDGKLMETLMFKSLKGNMVGQDSFGNKYFEDMDDIYGRHRWVLYADKDNMTGEDPSTVTAEWHGWLHFVTDYAPFNSTISKPIFHIETRPNPTGKFYRYMPKGSWFNPQRLNWQKFTAWAPPNLASSVRGAVADSASR